MKTNIDFYQHYANADQHPKFKMLRVKYGWAGEGKFWALNNKIAESEGCVLNITKKYTKASIASDLDFTLAEFDEFIDYLTVDCELVDNISDGCITTEIVQNNYRRVMEDREKARGRKKTPEQTPDLQENSPEPNPHQDSGSPGNQESSPELSKSSPEVRVGFPGTKQQTKLNKIKEHDNKKNKDTHTRLLKPEKVEKELCVRDPLGFTPKFQKNLLAETITTANAKKLFQDLVSKWPKKFRGVKDHAIRAFADNVEMGSVDELESLKLAYDEYRNSDSVTRGIVMNLPTFLKQWKNYIPEEFEASNA